MSLSRLAGAFLGSLLAANMSWAGQDFGAQFVMRTIPAVAEIGTAIILVVESAEPLDGAQVEFLGRRQPVFPWREIGAIRSYRAFLGIALNDTPGVQCLVFRASTRHGRALRESLDVEVRSRDFPEERIRLPEGKGRMLTGKELAEEAALLGRFLQVQDPAQAWEGVFRLPAQGRITSPFGFRRVYDDGTAAWQHRGVDLAGAPGDPVRAPNHGKVVLSRSLVAHGDTVVLDHGQGVLSVLNHLQDRVVVEGGFVSKGDLLGHVGSTGIATGPHLHWGLSVGNVRIDPLSWVARAMDQWATEGSEP
jgi:murein DD-endopeptidase MepM/ murein hydrolase activator NlpD